MINEEIDHGKYYRCFIAPIEERANERRMEIVISPPLQCVKEQFQQVADRLAKKRSRRGWVREGERSERRIAIEESTGKVTNLHCLLLSKDRFIRLTASKEGNSPFSERERHQWSSFFNRVAIYYPQSSEP